MHRIPLTNTLLGLIFVDCAAVILRVFSARTFFGEPGALLYVSKLVAILIAYAITVLWVSKNYQSRWDPILQTALLFGAGTGMIEVLNVALENGMPLALQNRSFQLAGILVPFALWGVAGFWVTRRLGPITAGLLASVASAAVCMLAGVSGGLIIELLLVRVDPAAIATWAEFKRSGWGDPVGFQIANTLDSAFSHLLLAPVVAAIFGALGSALGRRYFAPGQASQAGKL